jgi:hypothetical protein
VWSSERSTYQCATPTHGSDCVCKPPIAGIRQEFRPHSEDEVSDDVQSKPVGRPSKIHRTAPFHVNAAGFCTIIIIIAPRRIQNVDENTDVVQHPILKHLKILPAEELRMNLALEPHQPILSGRDQIRRPTADAQACVPFILAHVCADAIDIGVSARVVERKRVWRNPYDRP